MADLPPRASTDRRIWSGGALLVCAVLAAYFNSLQAPFVYDDTLAIAENPTIRHLWPLSDVLMPPGPGGLTVSGRPVLNLSFALSYALSGERVWGFHLVNLLVHAGAALLLFGIVRRTLRRREAVGAARVRSYGATEATALGFAIAALWALHPLQTQAVTYTVQRAESLMGLFYLLTLYAFVRAVEKSNARRWLALSSAGCLLGMGTKEVMATAPLVVLLYDRTFVAGSFGEALRRRRGYYALLAFTWVILGALMASTGGNRGGTVGIGVGVPWWAYGLTQFQAVARYLARTVWPQTLVFEWGTFWVERAGDILPYAAVVVPLIVLTTWALWRRPALGFCGASFFLILAPTSLAPGTIQMIVEHRMYLPLAAAVSVAVVTLARCVGGTATSVALSAALALSLSTAARNRDYRSHLTLWSDTVAKRPDNPRAHEGLAEALAELGRFDEAIAHRQEAVRLLPDESHYHYNLALTLASAGRTAEAEQHYRAALRLFPDEARTHNNLAILLVNQGRVAEALPHYAEAVRLSPNEPLYHYNRGIALMRERRWAEAAASYEAALRVRPDHADAHFNLANTLQQLGRAPDALAHFAAAYRLQPTDTEFAAGLSQAEFKAGNALLDLGQVTEAIPHYEAAVRATPTDAEAHHNLGIAFARLERWEEARREFDEALRLKPDYADAQRSRAQLRQVIGK